MIKDKPGSMQAEMPVSEDTGRLDISANDRRVFVEALINPQSVNDRLRDTVRRYRQATGV